MIINSPFRDYYDHCIGYGIDKGIVFNREQPVVIYHPGRSSAGRSALDDAAADITALYARIRDQIPMLVSDSHSTALVGFCGKVHLGVTRHVKNGKPMTAREYANGEGDPECRWSESEFSEVELNQEIVTDRWWLLKSNPKTLGEWFSRTEDHRVHEDIELFVKHNLVSFYMDSYRLILNPVLKDLNFQKVVDGVSAFQEIAMHVSGVLKQPEMKAEPISDVLRASSKGFDKNSFRRGPTK